ncbi:MAG: tetratricopeptide repeat protein [Phycisphaerae bacterium]
MTAHDSKRQHDYREEARLRDRVRAEPHQADGYGRLAAWLVRAGWPQQAREALREGLASADRPARLYHLLGLLLCGAGEFEAGLRHLERAVRQEPTSFTYTRDLALARGAAGRTASSVEALREAVGLAGAQGQAVEWLVRLGERAQRKAGGRLARRPPQPSRRSVAVEQIVARDPEVAEALIPRKGAPGAARRETLRASRRALASLAARRPSHADLYFGLSVVAEELGEVNRAIEAAEKALALNGGFVEACLLAVRLYEKAGRAERAEARCRQAADLRPQWPDVHVRLGRLLRDQGRPDEAAEAYRRALELGANSEEARRAVAAVAATDGAEGGDA